MLKGESVKEMSLRFGHCFMLLLLNTDFLVFQKRTEKLEEWLCDDYTPKKKKELLTNFENKISFCWVNSAKEFRFIKAMFSVFRM